MHSLDHLATQITAIKNRLQAIDRFAWPGLEEQVFADPFAPAARFFREYWYDPQQVVQGGVEAVRQQWMASTVDADDGDAWVEPLLTLAQQVLTLYGTDGQYLDFGQLQAEVQRDQAWLVWLEQQHHTLRLRTVRPLYRAVHPSRNLETLKGVEQLCVEHGIDVKQLAERSGLDESRVAAIVLASERWHPGVDLARVDRALDFLVIDWARHEARPPQLPELFRVLAA